MMRRNHVGSWCLAVLAILLAAQFLLLPSRAHEIRPALLDIKEKAAGRFEVIWKVPTRGQGSLAVLPILPESLELVGKPAVRDVPGAQIQRATFLSKGSPLTGQSIRIDGLKALQIDVLLRMELADGTRHTAILKPASPAFLIPEKPDSLQLAWSYLQMGFQHIIEGADHLLFILGLMLILRSTSMLIKTVTAFTVAHSITLAVATLGIASAPLPPLNVLIALSILFLGPEIVRVWRGQSSFTIRHPWVVAFAFGLLHGFGFASGLTSIGLPQGEIVLALLMFNLGVEAGQLFFVALILLMLRAFRQLDIHWPRWAQLTPGYAVGSLGAFWTMQRVAIMVTGG